MSWNWEKPEWPNFEWDRKRFSDLERNFAQISSKISGTYRLLDESESKKFDIELLTSEALKTSEIEGEILRRDSVQSSIAKNFGLKPTVKATKSEIGVANLLHDVFVNYAEPLSDEMLFKWHAELMADQTCMEDIGNYRSKPNYVISGPLGKETIHFEAPPAKRVEQEMNQFIEWFNGTSPSGSNPLSTLTRSAIAHLYFVSIHPFVDGNGRIARALSEKCMSQSLNGPALTSLSYTISEKRRDYYSALGISNKDLEITDWIIYFNETAVAALKRSIQLLEFVVAKTKLFDEVKKSINERQKKVLIRMFAEGIKGFSGGLSTENYIKITGTSRATATRDLTSLTEMGALKRTGKLKSTRYHLAIETE